MLRMAASIAGHARSSSVTPSPGSMTTTSRSWSEPSSTRPASASSPQFHDHLKVQRIIADRLDIGGARWGLDGAEAVLTLRALIANGDFDEYWPFHLAREHQRLYPGTKQGKYALGA